MNGYLIWEVQQDASERDRLHFERRRSTDKKFGCFVKIWQFTTKFQLESGICEMTAMETEILV